MTSLTALAYGVASTDMPARVVGNGPSFYADPAAWLVVAAVRAALADGASAVCSTSDTVGIIVVSNTGPITTMRDIARSARSGRVSPLRFAGSNPGILAGLPCITWKLRGPSLTLSMDPLAGLVAAPPVAVGWLRTGQARTVIMAVHTPVGTGQEVRCAVVRSAEPDDPPVDLSRLVPVVVAQ